MIPFDRNRNTGDGRVLVRYWILTKEEADERGVEYINWREATSQPVVADKVPDYDEQHVDRSRTYLLDDHGYVSPIFDGITLVNKRTGQHQVNFVFGRRYVSKKRFGYGHPKMTSNFSWDEKESRRERTRRVVVAYTRILLERSKLTEEDWMKLANLYRRDQEAPIKSIKRLFRAKAVKTMVRQELARVMESAGVTPDEIMSHYERLRKGAQEREDHEFELKVLDRFRDMADMQPDKMEVSGGVLETRDMTHLLKPDGGDDAEMEIVADYANGGMPETPMGLLEDDNQI